MSRLADHELLARGMSEAQLQQAVVNLGEVFRWRLIYHVPDSRLVTSPGFPDLVMAGHGRLVFAELKSHRGRIRPDQQRWINALAEAGAEVYVWRPADLLDGTIREVLDTNTERGER
jgi:hypothetical protein